MYQVIYIPRIQDEIVLAHNNDIISINNFMNRIKNEKPKSYKYYYIWDTINKVKLD